MSWGNLITRVCSGQDFPIVSADRIIDYFQKHAGENFVSLWPSYSYNNTNKKTHLDKRNDLYFPTFLMGRTLIKRLIKRIYIEISGGGGIILMHAFYGRNMHLSSASIMALPGFAFHKTSWNGC